MIRFLTEKELDKCWWCFKHHNVPRVRVRALGVILACTKYTYREVAAMLHVRVATVCEWVKWAKLGDLADKPGRGRKSHVNVEKVKDTIRMSPSQFGLDTSRWTMSSLKSILPELSNMSDSGIWRLLRRIGISWKRGQHKLTSPDPDYVEKKTA